MTAAAYTDEISEGLAEFFDRIVSTENNSDDRVYRFAVTFDNGYTMSMNRPTHGDYRGFGGAYADVDSFELMIFTDENEIYKTAEFPSYEDILTYARMADLVEIATEVVDK